MRKVQEHLNYTGAVSCSRYYVFVIFAGSIAVKCKPIEYIFMKNRKLLFVSLVALLVVGIVLSHARESGESIIFMSSISVSF